MFGERFSHFLTICVDIKHALPCGVLGKIHSGEQEIAPMECVTVLSL